MNVRMWKNLAVQENAATLKRRGATIVPPGKGELACGDVGEGRLADLDAIVRAAAKAIGER